MISNKETKLKYQLVIPVRLASKRLPGKPLEPIGDTRVLWSTIERCQRIRMPLVIAYEEPELVEHLPKGVKSVQVTGAKNGTHRVQQLSGLKHYGSVDVFINVQADECMLDPWIVVGMIRHFEKMAADKLPLHVTTAAANACSCDRFCATHTHVVARLSERCTEAVYFSKDPLPLSFHHVGVYGYPKQLLKELVIQTPLSRAMGLEQMAWMERGEPIDVVMQKWAAHAINRPEDLRGTQQMFADATAIREHAMCLGLCSENDKHA